MTTCLTEEEERKLILSAQRGNEQAFNRLITRYRPMVYEFAMQWLCNHDQAEDATQNAIIFAWLHLGEYQYKPAKFKHWLVSTVRRTSHEVERGYDSPAWLYGYYKNKAEQGITYHNEPETVGIDSRLAVDLTKTEREILELKSDGLSSAAIARKLHIKPRTVYNHSQNARRKASQKVTRKVID